ncbi:MAG: CRTAC1 family protein [Bryobacterales bacterium]|nr:CRTAC1 family protein [Bryobacterales bacterium]
MKTSLSRRNLLTMAVALSSPLRAQQSPLFVEAPSAETGITWVHENAMSDARHMPESLGPGAAFLDYDNDGWMDIYLVNSGPCDFYTPSKPIRNALYRNNRDGSFTDVTEAAGVGGGFFGMGVAVADTTNNGLPDLLVTGYREMRLYRNQGDGAFRDATREAGLGAVQTNSPWSTSAVFFDYNNDGFLDLFLCNYVEFNPGKNSCGDNKLGRNFYCTPRVFNPLRCVLMRNNGDGTFTNVTKGTEIETALSKALGVVATDINNDGLLDLWVANDTSPNFLFANRGSGKWEEIALPAEVAYSMNGQPRSGMGVDSMDLDGDGWMDLMVTNIDQEMYALYRNRGDESFEDVAHANEVAQATRQMSGWGLKFADFDHSGNPSLFIANGHPDDMIESYSKQVAYREPLLFFRHDGKRLRNVSATAGPLFRKSFAARGLAVGDYNNDGRLDVLVAVNGGAPVLARNEIRSSNQWLGVRLIGTSCNRDAIGARIRWSAAGKVRQRMKVGGGSYLSAHDPREVLGLGTAAAVEWVEIQWPKPSTRTERFSGLQPGRYHTLTEGAGKA